MDIRKDDTVQVNAGKDRGKRSKVQRVLRKDNLVVIEGVNVIKRHVKPRPNVRQTGIVQGEAPFPISRVMVVCTHCNRAVRTGHKTLEDGKKVRVCRSCQEVMD